MQPIDSSTCPQKHRQRDKPSKHWYGGESGKIVIKRVCNVVGREDERLGVHTEQPFSSSVGRHGDNRSARPQADDPSGKKVSDEPKGIESERQCTRNPHGNVVCRLQELFQTQLYPRYSNTFEKTVGTCTWRAPRQLIAIAPSAFPPGMLPSFFNVRCVSNPTAVAHSAVTNNCSPNTQFRRMSPGRYT